MKRCSASLVIREMQVKPIMRYSFTSIRICWWGWREIGTLIHCWWGCQMVQPLWKILVGLQNVKYGIIIWPNISTPRYIPKRIENRYSNNACTSTYVHSSTIHNSQKVETAHMFIKEYMDKQIVVCTYNVVLLSHKKEWNTDTWYKVNESQKHFAKWKKPDTKGHILCDSIYMKYPK